LRLYYFSLLCSCSPICPSSIFRSLFHSDTKISCLLFSFLRFRTSTIDDIEGFFGWVKTVCLFRGSYCCTNGKLWSSCFIANSLPHPCKISTRSFYSPDIAVEFCRRSGQQGLQLPLPPSGQLDNQSEGNQGLHRRLSPSSEVDSKSNSGQTRRRIAVAVSCVVRNDFFRGDSGLPTSGQCQRCRKRKIKCSGDPGNGQGCSNCRSAGSAPNTCTFLRVSEMMPLKVIFCPC
jgi:hypothetical protein